MNTILVFAGTSRPVPLPYDPDETVRIIDTRGDDIVYKEIGDPTLWACPASYFGMELITEADFMARQEVS